MWKIIGRYLNITGCVILIVGKQTTFLEPYAILHGADKVALLRTCDHMNKSERVVEQNENFSKQSEENTSLREKNILFEENNF